MAQAPISSLFWPTPRDQQGTLWGPRFTTLERIATNANIVAGGVEGTSSDWPLIGPDYLEWIENVRVRAIPGAGQNVTRMNLTITDSAGNEIVGLLSQEEDLAANIPGSMQVNPRVPLIGDRHSVRASAFFNSGVAANTMYLEVASIITVRGNVAVF